MDENRRHLANYYDESFLLCKNRVISTILFVLYVPFGLCLLIIRLTLLLCLYFASRLLPSLNTNAQFISLVSLCLGIYTKSNQNLKDHIHTKHLFVSNHVTCFDYVACKTMLNNLYLIDAPDYLNSETFFMTNVLKVCLNLKKLDTFYNQVLYFPECLTTNGRNELLKFDLDPIKDSKLDIKPICIECYRPFLFSTRFSVNLYESNQLINLVLFLFSPVTVYKLDFSLERIGRRDDENLEEMADKVRGMIGMKLGLKLSESKANDLVSKSNMKMENSMNKLANQIKDILPDVSYEAIQQHINSSPTLDIDTVIASILDSTSQESSLLRTQSSPIMSAPKPILQASKSTIFETKKLNKYKTYEEQKFELLNEARKRFLARDYNQSHKPEFF